MSISLDTASLRHWFLQQKRDLPWRNAASPYAVLVSEIMLQQTQVSVVIPYFLRWMERFSSFEALARASEEEVLKSWEGLGYYSRAKNLRKAAIFISQEWKGEIPATPWEIAKIPGVGPYTTGALLAFAFKKKAAAVDGNVMRVLSRYFCISDDISQAKTQKKFRKLAEDLLPENEPWLIAEGLIELGALICKKRAECMQCPLNTSCLAYQQNKVDELPVKNNQKLSVKLNRTVAVMVYKDKVLVRQVPQKEVMAGLHEFPYFEHLEDSWEIAQLQEAIVEKFSIKTIPVRKFPQVKHGFTHYRATLTPILLQCENDVLVKDYFWASFERLQELSFSSGHRRILKFVS